jgi:hypothetical protein
VLAQQTEMLATSFGGLVMVLREERLLSPAGLGIVASVEEALATLVETSTRIRAKFPPGDITGIHGDGLL